jgi:putative flippase GtrA
VAEWGGAGVVMIGSGAAVAEECVALGAPLPRTGRLVEQVGRFLVIGVGCTLATAVLYLALYPWLGTTWANLLSLAATTVVSSVANRKITFGQAQTVSRLRLHVQSVLVFLFYCVSTTLALSVLGLAVTDPSPTMQAAAVWGVSALGGTARFVLLRGWVFRATPGESRWAGANIRNSVGRTTTLGPGGRSLPPSPRSALSVSTTVSPPTRPVIRAFPG